MTTPMLLQYQEIKNRVPDAILFFRLGDFYEMFGKDAEIAAPVLEIVLTARDAGKGNKIPMCGIPYHASENYLNKLVSAGYKVAICEQIEDAQASKGIVKRDIVRIVTPGTIDQVSSETKNNYIACVSKEKDWGLAYLDITTGDFKVFQSPSTQVMLAELNRINPSELIFSEDDQVNPKLFSSIYVSQIPKSYFRKTEELLSRFQEQSSILHQMPSAWKAASALWQYVQLNMPGTDHHHVQRISTVLQNKTMMLDPWTRKNLELVETLRTQEEKWTLYSVLNHTKTAFGARLLRHWIQQPLLDQQEIINRLKTVEELSRSSFIRSDLQKALSMVYDLERLLGRLALGKANARDLLSLAHTLAVLPVIRGIIQDNQVDQLSAYIPSLSYLDQISTELIEAINPEAPFSLKEGNLINNGYEPEIDHLRSISTGGKEWIARLENLERERTKIRSLKISFNKVFGYYIEVTNANAHLVPDDYIRKQTLVNAERFVTPELKEYEQKVLSAQERLIEIEYSIFSVLRQKVLEKSREIINASQALAEIDVFVSLAETAVQNHYVKPEIRVDGVIQIVEGRHPVVERISDDIIFVPNDTYLTTQKHLALITGPNMAGKSTYMRQVALIVLMAQIGSFVPAQKASISMVDCIFTRVGASDHLASGQSTFMVEMNEVAHILHHATENSLVILDEVGRGTATFDGLSLAWAIAEYIIENSSLKAKTLFATHYHELTQLEERCPSVFNLHVAVKEQGDDVVFLHKILPGKADRSYGLHVAKIAGLPLPLLKRAAHILAELENTSVQRKIAKAADSSLLQPSLFESQLTHPLIKEIEELDMDNFTPRQALDYLYDLAQRVRSSKII